MMHNLLTQDLIQSDRGMHSLPGLLAAMARGEIGAFPALRPHQRPAWHMFLVQLATLALDAAGHRDLPATETEWAAALRTLTTEYPDDSPWHLVVDDPGRPAFMQPPDPGGLTWSDVPTPDKLDMLITTRNHDLKAHVARSAAAQDWVFALVSLQTMDGYKLKYSGILRMKSGASSRVMLTLAPCRSGTWAIDVSEWWRRDTGLLLESREPHSSKPGVLWVSEWPNGTQLSFESLDTLFIEVCRRVRLSHDGHQFQCRQTPESKPRIKKPTNLKGNTGDPWAPVHATKGEALQLSDQDFDYKLMCELLFGSRKGLIWKKPFLLKFDKDNIKRETVIVAEAFARGRKGKTRTDGFKSRVIPVPNTVVRQLFSERIVSLADALIQDIAGANKALSDALQLVVAEGDDEKRNETRNNKNAQRKCLDYIAPALTALQRFADRRFFEALWQQTAAGDEAARAEARLEFVGRLSKEAEDQFNVALPAVLCASVFRPRAEVRGWRALLAGLRTLTARITGKETIDV